MCPPALEGEPELLKQAQAGDAGAFETLVRPHLGLFQAVIQRILGNESETQDALQDALLSMYRELASFAGASAFSTWAYRVCVNQALMHRRKRVRRREDALEDLMPRFQDDGHPIPGENLLELSEEAEALVKVERSELRERIQAGLGRLSDDQRAVFVLRDLEGWDTDDIALRLGISRELVRQRLHRARLALRSLLADFMEGASAPGGRA
ncbi:MAG TPA: sigma-70 family RNA polymerase sigma factor [Holophagaceae bacterium]|nr:sigma-70 family RNA polymerase sigma factor [Holophagaceae bacterium]